MSIKHNFTKNLVKNRKLLGLTQEKLGELIGAESIDTISRYETGKNYPSFEKLEKIVSTLGITYDELLGDKSQSAPRNKSNIDQLWEIESTTLTGDEKKMFLEYIKTYKKFRNKTK